MSSQPAQQAHVAVVDDDPAVRDALRSCLEAGGYRVSEASSGKELQKLLAASTVDLITLDLGLHGEDGLAIAREIRAASKVPIIMITGKSELIDRVVGLELGADDYIAKPFHVREVLARVRSVLRRAEDASSGTTGKPSGNVARYEFSGWTLDCSNRELRAEHGGSTYLTAVEFNLLVVFLGNPRRTLTRDELLDLSKGQEWSANDRLIDNQVGRLKRKMLDLNGDTEVIRSVRGIGYVLASDVAAKVVSRQS